MNYSSQQLFFPMSPFRPVSPYNNIDCFLHEKAFTDIVLLSFSSLWRNDLLLPASNIVDYFFNSTSYFVWSTTD